MKVDVIVTAGGDAAPKAARVATSTIPVMAGTGDPVALGLAASLARPGGNVTGVSLMAPELGPKRLELLKEVAPRASRLAVLWNSTSTFSAVELRATEAGARALGFTLTPMDVKNAEELARAFAMLEKLRPDALTMILKLRLRSRAHSRRSDAPPFGGHSRPLGRVIADPPTLDLIVPRRYLRGIPSISVDNGRR